MQIEVTCNLIRDAIGKVLSVVDRKSTRPILSYALIESTKDNQIVISATDLEISVKITIPANVIEPGNICVNAKNLHEILRELPQEDIKLVTTENNKTLELHCNEIHYNLLVTDHNEFPKLVFSTSNGFQIQSEQMLNIINKTSHAVSSDETRLFLNGIFLQEINSRLRAVATNGHLLSLLDSDLSEGASSSLIDGVIIPKKGISELKKMADSKPGTIINISVDESFIYADIEGKYFISIRLISRDYPNYQGVIPNKANSTLSVDRDMFLNAVKRTKIMSNEKSNGIKINVRDGEMTFIANNPSLGHVEEKIPVEYAGKEINVGYNARYLIDTFHVLPEGEVLLNFTNELSPVVIKSNSLPDYLGLVMPLRL